MDDTPEQDPEPPKRKSQIEVIQVAGRPGSREVLVDGVHAGFIVKNTNGRWWGFGCDWPGFEVALDAARGVAQEYIAIQALLKAGK